jgi:plasmid maintenance system antidote protein VapI
MGCVCRAFYRRQILKASSQKFVSDSFINEKATGLRLSRYFTLNDGFWTGLQLDHDVAQAKQSLAKFLSKIKPLEIA